MTILQPDTQHDRGEGGPGRPARLQQAAEAQRHLDRHVGGDPGHPRRVREGSGDPRRRRDRRRRQGLRLGRRHLGVREGAQHARAGRLLRQDRRGRQRAPQQVLQADDRPHPRLLHRRRPGGVAALRHPHRLGQQQVRRAGGAARPRLSRQRPQDPDGSGRAVPRQGDLLHGAALLRAGSARHGAGHPRSCPTPSSTPTSTTTAS